MVDSGALRACFDADHAELVRLRAALWFIALGGCECEVRGVWCSACVAHEALHPGRVK